MFLFVHRTLVLSSVPVIEPIFKRRRFTQQICDCFPGGVKMSWRREHTEGWKVVKCIPWLHGWANEGVAVYWEPGEYWASCREGDGQSSQGSHAAPGAEFTPDRQMDHTDKCVCVCRCMCTCVNLPVGVYFSMFTHAVAVLPACLDLQISDMTELNVLKVLLWALTAPQNDDFVHAPLHHRVSV